MTDFVGSWMRSNINIHSFKREIKYQYMQLQERDQISIFAASRKRSNVYNSYTSFSRYKSEIFHVLIYVLFIPVLLHIVVLYIVLYLLLEGYSLILYSYYFLQSSLRLLIIFLIIILLWSIQKNIKKNDPLPNYYEKSHLSRITSRINNHYSFKSSPKECKCKRWQANIHYLPALGG